MKTQTPGFFLSFYHGQELIKEDLMLSGELRIGRHNDNDLVIEHPGVSRHHATLLIQKDPVGYSLVLRDEGSTNGCSINDQEVRKKMVPVLPQDVVLIGPVRLKISAVLHDHPGDEEGSFASLDDYEQTIEIDLSSERVALSSLSPDPVAQQRLRELQQFASVAVDSTEDRLLVAAADGISNCLGFDTMALLLPTLRGVEVVHARNRQGPCAPSNVPLSKSIIKKCLNKKVGILIEKESEGELDEDHEKSTILALTNSLICVPVVKSGEILAIIYVASRSKDLSYGKDELELLVLFASNLANSLLSKKAVLAAEAQKNKLEAVLSSLKEGVVVTDENLVVVSANAAALQIFEDTDLVGKSIRGVVDEFKPKFCSGEPWQMAKTMTYVKSCSSGVKSSCLCEGDSRQKIFSVTVSMNDVPGGGDWKYVFCVHDINKIHRLERMKSILVHRLAHKLKTPLTIMATANSLAVQNREAIPDPELKDLLLQSERCTEECITLMDRLTEYTQLISNGVNVTEWMDCRAEEMLREAAVANQLLIEEKYFHVKDEFGGSPLRLRGDRQLLQLVFNNLVENAVKFGKQGGVLTVGAEPDGEQVKLVFHDNGPGIPPSETEFLGVLLYQVDPYDTGEVPGMGIGLALVNAVVQAHGGRLKITSPAQNGEGTLVHVVLPGKIQVSPPAELSEKAHLSATLSLEG